MVRLGEGSLLLLLLVTAGVCILMGMGLPTVGVYLLLSTLAAPPLIVLALIDITFMFVERTAKRFQVFDLTNAFKSLAVVLLAPVYTLFFAYYLKAEISGALAVIRRFPEP